MHLDKVQDGSTQEVYRQPEQFFSRTFLTQNLIGLAAEVVRRLSGETTETSAVFNMTTQFGGGKTHALTLLYHLAKHGAEATVWPGGQWRGADGRAGHSMGRWTRLNSTSGGLMAMLGDHSGAAWFAGAA